MKKRSVKRRLKDAFCKKLADGTGYVIWPGKIQPRGFERPACGFGKTAKQAWSSVKFV